MASWTTTEINNYDDIIDSRDVIARIADLECESEDRELDEDEVSELNTLNDLARAGESATEDWQYGATLIHDSYFTTYAQDTAEDIHGMRSQAEWPFNCIDWEQAATDLQADYTIVTFDGETYWTR